MGGLLASQQNLSPSFENSELAIPPQHGSPKEKINENSDPILSGFQQNINQKYHLPSSTNQDGVVNQVKLSENILNSVFRMFPSYYNLHLQRLYIYVVY